MWERSKERWNKELEENVKKAQAVDWGMVVGRVEEGASSVWRKAFQKGEEGVVEAEKVVRREG